MDSIKSKMLQIVDKYSKELFDMACDIFDNPELGYEEFYASKLLSDYLESKGFVVERGIANLPTAFKAVWENGTGGPSIAFLGEYDALAGIGHACGHHLQTPVCIGAALALREAVQDLPYRIEIFGTPAEETTGGKIPMVEAGCFKGTDVAFSYHSGGYTGVSLGSTALQSISVTFHGIPSHAAGSPEKGRSALDAMVLSFHGLECLREHVRSDCRIHYTITAPTGMANIVHETASAKYTLRSAERRYLEDMIRRFKLVIEGAALMTETTYDIEQKPMFYNLICIPALKETFYANAEEMGLEDIYSTGRKSSGSTDVGNVSWVVPTIMARTFYSDKPGHSHEWIEAGKGDTALSSLKSGAGLFAMTAYHIIRDSELLARIKAEFKEQTAGN